MSILLSNNNSSNNITAYITGNAEYPSGTVPYAKSVVLAFKMIFESTEVEKVDEENYYVYGNLTMKGVTKPVKLNIEYSGITKDQWGGERAGFTVTG